MPYKGREAKRKGKVTRRSPEKRFLARILFEIKGKENWTTKNLKKIFQKLQNCFGPPAWVGPSSVETHADFAPDSGNETQTTGGAPWSRETPTRQAKQKRIQYVLLGGL